ncbi:autophagy-related protein 27 [Xylariaceae sp. FL0594]|nr:autophagy-related protein 27 [Xylariaceae sp. FL0594]
MKFSRIPSADAALFFSLLLAPLQVAAMFRCNNIVADGQQYNLEKLGGPHSVVTSRVDGEILHNTTYTVDICQPLKRSNDVKKSDQCPSGSRACAIRHLIKPGEKGDTIERATPLAGDWGSGQLEPSVSRLSEDDLDSGKEGLRVILKGGYNTTESGVRRKQSTVIDFICDKDREGTEGEYDSEDKYVAGAESLRARADEKKEDEKDGKDGEKGDEKGDDKPSKEVQLGLEKDPSLVFDRYGPSDSDVKVDILHLTWSTKYVCQNKADDGSDGNGDGDAGEEPKKPASSHWGAFTWIVLLGFLGIAAYLVFGSWLNYNRYGARGWDLLPHGDTIRELPYLLRDWVRRVLNTVQGSGSRGGYSAV